MRAIVYTVGLLVLVPFILRQPWLGIPAWNFLGLINPQGFVWGFAMEIPYAALVGGCTLLGLLYTKERAPLPVQAQTILLGLLVFWMTVTTVFAWTPGQAWDQWNKVMKILLMTIVTIILIHGRMKTRVLMLAITCAIGLLGLKGGLFVLRTGGQQMVQGPGGFLGGNTELGLALAMVLPLLIVLARDTSNRWARWSIWATFWLSILATVFTYSRGALLGLAAVMFAMFWGIKRKGLVLAFVVPCVLLALPLIPQQLTRRAETIATYEQDASAMGRIVAWNAAIKIASTNPTGAGFNPHMADPSIWLSYASAPDLDRTIAAHSIYFQVLGDHGFLGLALFLVLLVTTWRALGSVRRASAKVLEQRWLADYAWAIRMGLVGYMVSGAFLSLAYFDLFYTFVALSVILQRELSRSQSQSAAHPLMSTQAQSGTAVSRLHI